MLTAGLRGEQASPLKLLSKPGHYALMRHALAPGTGDPADLDLKDCGTQRNLSAEGRKQAAGIGNHFRKQGIKEAEVLTSQWCRCRDTAILLDLGEVKELPALNSFFGRPRKRDPQMKALRTWFENHNWEGPTVLVTHQVVITALTGVFPASGEIVIVQRKKDGTLEVVARLPFR